MKKFYKGTEIRRRIDELKAEMNKEGNEEVGQERTMMETFFDPEIRGAAWVGFFLVSFQ